MSAVLSHYLKGGPFGSKGGATLMSTKLQSTASKHPSLEQARTKTKILEPNWILFQVKIWFRNQKEPLEIALVVVNVRVIQQIKKILDRKAMFTDQNRPKGTEKVSKLSTIKSIEQNSIGFSPSHVHATIKFITP